MKRDELVKRLALAIEMKDEVRLKIFQEVYLDHLSDQEKESIKIEVEKQIEADMAGALRQDESTGDHATLKIDDLTFKPS